MSRLIDADELKRALADMWYESAISITGVSVSELIDNAPTIEPIEDIKSCGVSEEEQNTLPSAEDWDKYSEKLWHLAYERGQNDRPKGEWKKRLGAYWCSECNRPTVDKTPFCSECGADMRTK